MEPPLVAPGHFGGAPYLPLEYDNGLYGLEAEQSLPLIQHFTDDEMTACQSDNEDMQWINQQLFEQAVATLEAGKFPGQQSHLAVSEGSSSLSPTAASHRILTPTSTIFGSPFVTNLDEDPESDTNISTSPESDVQSEEYVLLSRRGRQARSGNSMNDRHPPVSSGVSSSAVRAQPLLSQPNQVMRVTPWQSFASSSSGSMEDASAANCSTTRDFEWYPNDDLLTSNMGDSFDTSSFGPAQAFGNLPLRVQNDGSMNQAAYSASTAHPPLQPLPQSHHTFAHSCSHTATYSTSGYMAQLDVTSHGFTPTHLQSFSQHLSIPSRHYAQAAPQPPPLLASNTASGSRVNTSTSSNSTLRAPAPHSAPSRRGLSPVDSCSSPTGSQQSASPFRDILAADASTFGNLYQAIKSADPSRAPQPTHRAAQAESKVQKGGRKKNTHLPEQSRQRSHAMRRVGACWRCALQRDPCDHGDPCSRCAMREQRGQQCYFGCDRSKLPDFVHDFLPHSLCRDHQKQVIEDTVSQEVVTWHSDNSIDVYLSSGYGPPLRWKLYEFSPKTQELLYQLQYFQDPQSGRSYKKQKYSPPYGLLKIDSVDDANFEAYLDDLLEAHHLKELGESCYAEENLVDPEMFQCRLLDLMCQLYVRTADYSLRVLLRDILRMMIITYIMGHTLTITEDTLYPVVANVKHSPRPSSVQEHTSPRLANRQLKFFFHILRNSIYEKILKWQQQTLHTAGKKDQTWLHAFCVMLGFAMVLEEVQRTILCQADAKVWRGQATQEQATTEAYNACGRIDARFTLLIGLFQCKYRDRKWGEHGSFGNQTPEVKDPAAQMFLLTLRRMVEQRKDHLQRRESVDFSLDNECLYTTRLTARFLLPFLKLPPS